MEVSVRSHSSACTGGAGRFRPGKAWPASVEMLGAQGGQKDMPALALFKAISISASPSSLRPWPPFFCAPASPVLQPSQNPDWNPGAATLVQAFTRLLESAQRVCQRIEMLENAALGCGRQQEPLFMSGSSASLLVLPRPGVSVCLHWTAISVKSPDWGQTLGSDPSLAFHSPS